MEIEKKQRIETKKKTKTNTIRAYLNAAGLGAAPEYVLVGGRVFLVGDARDVLQEVEGGVVEAQGVEAVRRQA
jgi:hypothetical protein